MEIRKKHQFIIIGGGPGGIQLAYYLQKLNADYLILEQSEIPGNTFNAFPRHRKLISINKRFTGCTDPEFNMRHDWNSLLCDDDEFRFKQYDKDFFPHADNLVQYLGDFVERFQINIKYSTSVVKIERHDDIYCIRDQNDNLHFCDVLIVATGLIKPNIPKIEGIELAENYTEMDIDPSNYEDQRVLIIGKKNSAFETADSLVSAASLIHLVSPSSIKMAWKTHYVGDLRAINNSILDTYQLKSQNAILDAEVASITKQGDQLQVTFSYAHAGGEEEKIVYDRVICCAGFKFDDSIFSEDTIPDLMYKGKYPELTPSFESVNNPNMYFAGTLTHSLDYKKATSGFIHGFRYNSRALAELLAKQYLGIDFNRTSLKMDPRALANMMLDRVNHSGGLWQQPGFIADVAICKNKQIEYVKELPKEYVLQSMASDESDVYVLTLEYGDPIVGDPFAVERIHREDTVQAHKSQFLHPIIRRYIGKELVAQHDVIEDLEAKWVEPEHFEPLTAFFEEQLYMVQSDMMKELA
jgi:thioredoxin reductase